MRIGIPRESQPGATLVAATTVTAAQLESLGYDVVVESGAGVAADQTDAAFTEAGIRVTDAEEVWASDIVIKVNAPSADEIWTPAPGGDDRVADGARSQPQADRAAAGAARHRAGDGCGPAHLARAGDGRPVDMANVAGYRAVIEAAHEFGRQFTGQVTAAGKVPPARVFVVGAGVAGLAAIGAAGAMGAIVRAFDVRPEVAEQVESLGGRVRHGRHGAGGRPPTATPRR